MWPFCLSLVVDVSVVFAQSKQHHLWSFINRCVFQLEVWINLGSCSITQESIRSRPVVYILLCCTRGCWNEVRFRNLYLKHHGDLKKNYVRDITNMYLAGKVLELCHGSHRPIWSSMVYLWCHSQQLLRLKLYNH